MRPLVAGSDFYLLEPRGSARARIHLTLGNRIAFLSHNERYAE
jgi:hypothetical protein